jgi:Domain of unknown function (DUF4192)
MTASKKSARRRRRQKPRTRLKVGQPDELLAIIPYVVGFHPDESIVAVFIKSGRIWLTARMDLPPESAAGELAEHIDYLLGPEEVGWPRLAGFGVWVFGHRGWWLAAG